MKLELIRKRLKANPTGKLVLNILTGFYSSGVRLRNLFYNWGIIPARKLPVRIICIGNLTTGGTGKTPAVLLAATTLRKNEIKTAILTRGYKRPHNGKDVQVLLKSKDMTWKDTGDEPWMMHRALKGLEVPILVHPNRYAAGEAALNYYGPQVLLLDDGFQHRRLHRDLDIVLINALDPFGGGRLLPHGNLREPISSLKRANLAVITHSDQVPKKEILRIRERIERTSLNLPILEAEHRADFLFDLKEEHRKRLSHIKEKKIACFSAIGDPLSFEDLLRRTGAEILQSWRFPDHHIFTEEEIRSIENIRDEACLVTTLKDFPRLPHNWKEILSGEVLALSIKLEITKGKKIWEEAICAGFPSPAAAKS